MTESLPLLWKQCVTLLSHTIPAQHLDTWIKPIKPLTLTDHQLTIEVPSPFFKEWVTTHHLALIESALTQAAGHTLRVEVMASPVRNDGLSPIFHQPKTPPPEPQALQLESRPRYTFDNFVVGNSNRFAHAACMAVAEAPGKSYNPLFLHGGAGLGKTHLLRAIGHLTLVRTPHIKVLYLTCEAFMNEMIASIRGGHERMVEFRRKFRRADVFLIDDIQFLEGKESTQEEFFHTFNELYESGRQIVASSDSHPKDISLEERLKSRFEMGLIADIKAPDYETRMAILTKKAEEESALVPEDILHFIASHATTNIRQLEGALVRLLAIATLTSRPLDLDLAKDVLRGVAGLAASTTPTMQQIQEVVAEFFHFSPADLASPRRTKEVSYARQLAMYLIRELTKHSLPEVGAHFGGRDHTTVLHACETVRRKLSTDARIPQHLEQLLQQLQPKKF